MGEVSQIDVKLDRKTFDIVLQTFSLMHDHYSNPAIIDPAALMLSQREIGDMIAKLKSRDSGQDVVTIPMPFHDWTVYYGLLAHTSDKIPQAEPDAYAVLDNLLEEYGRLDDAGLVPTGGQTLSQQHVGEALRLFSEAAQKRERGDLHRPDAAEM